MRNKKGIVRQVVEVRLTADVHYFREGTKSKARVQRCWISTWRKWCRGGEAL